MGGRIVAADMDIDDAAALFVERHPPKKRRRKDWYRPVPKEKSGLVEPINCESVDGAIEIHLPRFAMLELASKYREPRGFVEADLVTLWKLPGWSKSTSGRKRSYWKERLT